MCKGQKRQLGDSEQFKRSSRDKLIESRRKKVIEDQLRDKLLLRKSLWSLEVENNDS